MRCKECKQAFNGTDKSCPFCGTDHTEKTIVSTSKVMPDPVKEEKPEVKQPAKKVVESKAQPQKAIEKNSIKARRIK